MARVHKRTAPARPAFSIVELMVVIGIIFLLISILVPALRGAYRAALVVADDSLIHQISMGCEAYHQDFHEYPLSASVNLPFDTPDQPRINPTNAPYFWPPLPVDPKVNHARLVGAAKVFASLVGFNTMGTGSGNASDMGCNDVDISNWTPNCGQTHLPRDPRYRLPADGGHRAQAAVGPIHGAWRQGQDLDPDQPGHQFF